MADEPAKLNARQYNRTVAQTLKQVLRDHQALNLQCATVIGFDADGEFYIKTARLDNGRNLWLAHAFMQHTLEGKTNLGIDAADVTAEERAVTQFKTRNTEINDAKPESKATPHDAGSEAQPEIRQEGRDQPKGRE